MFRRTIELVAAVIALLVMAMAFHAWRVSHDEQQRLQSTLAAQKQLIDAADARERVRDSSLKQTLDQIDKLKRANQSPQQLASELQAYLQLPEPITLVPATLNPADAANAPRNGTADVASARQGTAVSANAASPSRGPASSLFQARPWLPASPVPEGRRTPSGQFVMSESTAGTFSHPAIAPACAGTPRCENSNTFTTEQAPPGRSATEGSSAGVSPRSAVAQASAQPPKCEAPNDCAAQIPAADLKPLYDYVQDCRACQAKLSDAQQNAADAAAKIAALTRERDAAITAAKGGAFPRRLRRNALWFALGATVAYAATHPRQKGST
jgi:hypothetical protein